MMDELADFIARGKNAQKAVNKLTDAQKLAKLDLAKKEIDRAIQLLGSAIEETPDAAMLRFIQIRLKQVQETIRAYQRNR